MANKKPVPLVGSNGAAITDKLDAVNSAAIISQNQYFAANRLASIYKLPLPTACLVAELAMIGGGA